MSLREQMALDAEAIFNDYEFAEAVAYTPDDAPSVMIKVIIAQGADYGRSQGPVVSGTGFMRVLKKDFPNEKPKGSIIRADGSVWTIGQEMSSNMMTRRLEIKTRPRAAFKEGRAWT